MPRRGGKHRGAKSNQNQRLLRENVNIPDDTWLETLKFMTCPQWSQKCFVSRQINRLAQGDISRLPKTVLDNANMYYIEDNYPEELKELLSNSSIIAFDTIMQEEQSTQWLESRGFSLDAPVDILAEDALIGVREWKCEDKSNVNLCIHGSAQVFFYARFNPVSNQHSWSYLAQFLNLVYHPTSYIKEVKMFGVNQNFIDSLKCNIGSSDNEHRYIRCESFSLEEVGDVADSLKWLVRNVRAETIRVNSWIDCEAEYVMVAKFLFDPSGAKQCVSEKIYVDAITPVAFLNILIEKYREIPPLECAIPTISAFWYGHRELPAHLGTNLIDREVDSQGSDAFYFISNEQKQMRISIRRADNRCNVSIY